MSVRESVGVDANVIYEISKCEDVMLVISCPKSGTLATNVDICAAYLIKMSVVCNEIQAPRNQRSLGCFLNKSQDANVKNVDLSFVVDRV